jgi:hypothetical protein
MKKLIIISSALLISLSAFSQIKFGIKAGPNFSNIVNDDSDTKMKVGFHAGLIGEIGIGPIQAETGAAFSQAGTRTEFSVFGIKSTTDITINQIEVPLMLGFQFGIEALSIVPQVGGFFSYSLSGKSTSTSLGQTDTDKIEFGTDPGMLNPLDYGLRVGLKAQITKIRAGLYYNIGLQNIFNDNDDITKTSNLLISAAFMF